MMRSFVLAIAATCFVVGLSFAEPRLEIRYHSGVPELILAGTYPNAHYTVTRATASNGAFEPITDLNTLCMGSCFAIDYDAAAGRTYWYRFELLLDDGTIAHFGPYDVSYPASLIRHIGATVSPNPARGASRIELVLTGSPADAPLPVEATLLDLQGRRVRTFWSGPMRRGVTAIAWDGRTEEGRSILPGQYFLRFTSPLGSRVTRVIRIR